MDKITANLELIPTLDSPNDWIRWERQVTELLGFSGYGRYLEKGSNCNGITAIENETDKEKTLRQETWENNQDKALWYMKARCGANAKELLVGKTTVASGMAALRERFRPTGSAVFQNLHQAYRMLTLANCKGRISVFAERLRTAKAELESLDSSVAIAEPFFVDHFLSGLTPEYSTFLATFHQTHSLIAEKDGNGGTTKAAVTFNQAVTAAERFEQGLQSLDRPREIGLVARQSGSLKPGTPCTVCGKAYHTANECWQKYPHLKEEFHKTDRGRRNLKHKKSKVNVNEIPLPSAGGLAHQQRLPEFEGGAGFGFVATAMSGLSASQNTAYLSRHWVLDTGCSHHISCSKEVFLPETLRPYTGPPMIGLGGGQTKLSQIGTAILNLCVNGQLRRMRLSNTLYCPDVACNLVSASQLQRKGAKLAFTDTGMSVSTATGLTTYCEEQNGVYLFNLWQPVTGLAAYSLNQD